MICSPIIRTSARDPADAEVLESELTLASLFHSVSTLSENLKKFTRTFPSEDSCQRVYYG